MREMKYKLLKASRTEIEQSVDGSVGYLVKLVTCGLVQRMPLFSQRG
jgi:flagellar biosynthesis/type III secretory pathway ATPase